jgi:hypothetical protein
MKLDENAAKFMMCVLLAAEMNNLVKVRGHVRIRVLCLGLRIDHR